ncbi:putative mucin-2-like protein [Leptotrombidium deliense]|uniref:Putative mucin-2-like protein n=1 Tax=Leptotrombidium deliense TaxID=299467 RepID=A0A443SEZ9_9ACAR|nr:putative mucin-2-like protein [Leptotrombidium deliense]
MRILAIQLCIHFLIFIVILQGNEAQHYLGIRGQNFEGKPMLRSHKSLSACGTEQFVGFYADTENGCQTYRMCYGGRQNTFLCPPGTLFSQILMTCDFWHKVNCNNGQRRKFTEITPPSTSSTPVYYNNEEPEWTETAVEKMKKENTLQ